MWFECITAHGSSLGLRHDGRIAHLFGPQTPQLYLYRPAAEKPLGFLVAADPDRRCFILPSLYRARALPVLIKASGTHVSILAVDERCYLTAVNVVGADGYGEVFANRRKIDGWELFSLKPVVSSDIKIHDLAFASATLDILNVKDDPAKIRDYLTDKLAFAALEGIIPLLSYQVKSALSSLLMNDEDLISALRRYYPDNQWATIAVPDLHSWLHSGEVRKAAREMRIGPEFDWLSGRYLPEIRRGIRPMNMPEILVRAARRSVKPTRTACMLATARNEGIYYLEWLAYHRAIGFEQFFIYSNDNDDYSDELLTALANGGAIHFIRSEMGHGGNAQAKAYGHALGFHPAILDYAWTMVCDLDEFVLLDQDYFKNIGEFLAWHEICDVDAISLSWPHVSASGQRTWNESPMIDRFNDKPFYLDTRVKSLFRTQFAAQSYAHFPSELEGNRLIYRNAVGDVRQTAKSEDIHGIHGRHLDDDPDFRMAQLLHYYWKSAEEFLWKHSRTKGDHAFQKETGIDRIHPAEVQHFLRHFGEITVQSGQGQTEPRRLARSFDVELYKLRSLPGVAEAESVIKQHFAMKVASLKAEFFAKDMVSKLGDVGRQFADLLMSGSERPADRQVFASERVGSQT